MKTLRCISVSLVVLLAGAAHAQSGTVNAICSTDQGWCEIAAREFTRATGIRVAQAHKAAVVPFFLKGVADGPDPTRLFQPDRIHPRAEAHPQMLANVWPELKKLLR